MRRTFSFAMACAVFAATLISLPFSAAKLAERNCGYLASADLSGWQHAPARTYQDIWCN